MNIFELSKFQFLQKRFIGKTIFFSQTLNSKLIFVEQNFWKWNEADYTLSKKKPFLHKYYYNFM